MMTMYVGIMSHTHITVTYGAPWAGNPPRPARYTADSASYCALQVHAPSPGLAQGNRTETNTRQPSKPKEF